MDITVDFRSVVATVRADLNLPAAQSHIIKAKSLKSAFTKEAIDVLEKVQTMRGFLADHYMDYVNAARYMSSKASKMTEAERNSIDQEATLFAHGCISRIDQMKASAAG
jgi:hypothetical protein